VYVSRQIEQQLIKYSSDNKALVILGARQVGKTTILRHVFPDADWYSGDDADMRSLFSNIR
jgi:predicted AAA+ superfamily ATPase